MGVFPHSCIRHKKVGMQLACTLHPPHHKPANDHEAIDGVPRHPLGFLAQCAPGNSGKGGLSTCSLSTPTLVLSAVVGVETATDTCDDESKCAQANDPLQLASDQGHAASSNPFMRSWGKGGWIRKDAAAAGFSAALASGSLWPPWPWLFARPLALGRVARVTSRSSIIIFRKQRTNGTDKARTVK